MDTVNDQPDDEVGSPDEEAVVEDAEPEELDDTETGEPQPPPEDPAIRRRRLLARIAFWSLFSLVALLAAIEAHGRRCTNSSFNAVAVAQQENPDGLRLSEVRSLVSGWPIVSQDDEVFQSPINGAEPASMARWKFHWWSPFSREHYFWVPIKLGDDPLVTGPPEPASSQEPAPPREDDPDVSPLLKLMALDRQRDDQVLREEVPAELQEYFDSIDSNGDKVLDDREMQRASTP